MLTLTSPLLVGVVVPRRMARDLAVLRRTPPDVLEYRADLQRSLTPQRVPAALHALRSHLPRPLLFTLRDASEGGEFDGGDALRASLYAAALPHVDAIDVEIACRSLLKPLHSALAHHKVSVVASFHDFSETPDQRALDGLVRTGFAAGAQIVKIACHCATVRDALRLLALPQRHAGRPLAIVGMGPLGRAVRMVAPAFGSVLGYAAASAAVAPGQLTAAELQTAWSLMGDPAHYV